MFKKSPLKATRLAQHKRRMRWVKIISSFILLVIFIFGLSWLTKARVFAITSIQVEGNAAIDSNAVTKIVQDDLAGNYYYLFSRLNRFLYPKQKILHDLSHNFPRIQNVKLSVRSGHSLFVSITERSPAYTWCIGTPDTSDQNQCYFMDNQGYVFSQAPAFSGNAYFAFYGLVNPQQPIGSQYLSNQTLHSISDLSAFLQNNNIHSYALLAASSDEYDLYFNNESKIIFKPDQNMSDLMTDIQAIIKNTQVFSNHSTSTLDYIDMRYGNKIYYKYSSGN